MELAGGFDLSRLIQDAKIRWLKAIEVHFILKNHQSLQLRFTHKPLQKPLGGTLHLFNRRVNRYFRNDGHSWQRKKNGKTLAEGHERLKVNNVEVLTCYYTQGAENPCFRRRIYWMLDQAYEHVVLVHYREVLEGKYITGLTLNFPNGSYDTPNPNPNHDPSIYVSPTSGLTGTGTGTGQNSSSPGSANEVSSQLAADTGDNTESISEWVDTYNQYEDKLEEFRVSDFAPKGGFQGELESSPRETMDLGVRVRVLDFAKEDRLNGELELGPSETMEGIRFPDIAEKDELSNPGEKMEGIRVRVLDFSEEEIDNTLDGLLDDLKCTENGHTEDVTYSTIERMRNSVLWMEELPFEETLNLKESSNLGFVKKPIFTIREISPEWAFSYETTKVIITGDFPSNLNLSDHPISVQFGETTVPIELVQEGVIRCWAPLVSPGRVNLQIIDFNGESCSNSHEFEFRENAVEKLKSTEPDPSPTSDELNLLVKLVNFLLNQEKSENLENSENLEILGCNLILDWVLHELLKDKLEQWVSKKIVENGNGNENENYVLSEKEQGIIHLISGLGYDWALKLVLSLGVNVNFRDSNGWTALHWAARFGREQMVASLLVAGASAEAVTDPTCQRESQTPASIAEQFGYRGLAGFLSEAKLTNHPILSEPANQIAVNSISQRPAHMAGGTEDQLSLKDSLEGARNAVQAATRIQAAFRAYSFRKKQEKSMNSRNNSFSLEEICEAVCWAGPTRQRHVRFESAALSIQKNYRCYKKRKEYLTLRRNVVKIQAHYREHKARKYEVMLWTVSMLEKVILRWHKRGVGLRGFQPNLSRMIEQEDEDDIIRVFRRQKVKTALDQAVSQVLSMVDSSEARMQYRHMLALCQQTKNEREKS